MFHKQVFVLYKTTFISPLASACLQTCAIPIVKPFALKLKREGNKKEDAPLSIN